MLSRFTTRWSTGCCALVRPRVSWLNTLQRRTVSSRSPGQLSAQSTDSFQLRNQIQRMCKQQNYEEAVQLIMKSTPHGAQELLPAWSSLISNLFAAKKSRLALDVWQDAKKRGLRPDERFHIVAFNAVQPDALTPSIQQELNKHHQRYISEHQQEQQSDAPPDPSTSGRAAVATSMLSTAPTNVYINILQRAGYMREAFDTIHALPKTGPLAADTRAFMAIFTGLAWLSPAATAALDFDSLQAAENLWETLLSRSKGDSDVGFEAHQLVDARTAQAWIYLLSRSPERTNQLKTLWITSELNNLPLQGETAALVARSRGTQLSSGQSVLQTRPTTGVPGLTPSLEVLRTLQDAQTSLAWVQAIAQDPIRWDSIRPKDFHIVLTTLRKTQRDGQMIRELKELYAAWRGERQAAENAHPQDQPLSTIPEFESLEKIFASPSRRRAQEQHHVKEARKSANKSAYTEKQRRRQHAQQNPPQWKRQSQLTRN